jgi:N-terminal half of MaoC dehydratase
MRQDTLGKVLVDTDLVVDEKRLAMLSDAIGTDSAKETALRVAFFGPTAAGQNSVVDSLEMDLTRALQGGQAYEWHRSFVAGETVHLRVVVEDIIDKGTMELATVLAEFHGQDGALIQRQRTTFIERAETSGNESAEGSS